MNTLKQQDFSARKIASIKRSDAKLFVIGLQDSGKSYSSIRTIRGVLRPAFQMEVDDEVIRLIHFDFHMASVLIDDRGRREAISKKEMEKFLKFVHDDKCYYKYYEAFYILFHTGLRISEFCGLTVKDLDMEKQILNVDHQLQRRGDSRYIIETTKTNAGTRRIPMTGDVYACFQSILESRRPPKPEPMIDGYYANASRVFCRLRYHGKLKKQIKKCTFARPAFFPLGKRLLNVRSIPHPAAHCRLKLYYRNFRCMVYI